MALDLRIVIGRLLLAIGLQLVLYGFLSEGRAGIDEPGLGWRDCGGGRRFPLDCVEGKIGLNELVVGLKAAFVERYGREPRVFRAPGRVNLIQSTPTTTAGMCFRRRFLMCDGCGGGAARGRPAAGRHHWRCRRRWTCRWGIGQFRELDGLRAGRGGAAGEGRGRGPAVCDRCTDWRGAEFVGGAERVDGVCVGNGATDAGGDRAAVPAGGERVYGNAVRDNGSALELFREEGKALLIDCRDLSYQTVAIPDGVRLVIANTMVKHELGGSEYNDRRAACEMAAARLDAPYLRDVEYAGLEGAELCAARGT